MINADDSHDSTANEQRRIRPWKDPDRLRRLYHDDGLTQSEIAHRFGIDDSTVSYWFTKFGIETGYSTHSEGVSGDE
jgi:DNA-binding transcriptional regulator LsrR (DeoR family)